MQTLAISVEQASFSYEGTGTQALVEADFEVNPGEFVGIIGATGAGKTTLARMLNGAIPHYYQGEFYGSVRAFGNDTFETDLTDLACFVGFVGADIDAQMVASVVEDEVFFGLENFGVPREEGQARAREAMERLGIADLARREIASLSGGQRQKVALAALLALRPQALVLDEPTGELDPQSSHAVFGLLRELASCGIAVVAIEQKIMLLSQYVERLVVMDSGRIVLDGPVHEVLAQNAELSRIGVNMPRVTTLSVELAKRGVFSGNVAATVEEAVALVKEAVA